MSVYHKTIYKYSTSSDVCKSVTKQDPSLYPWIHFWFWIMEYVLFDEKLDDRKWPDFEEFISNMQMPFFNVTNQQSSQHDKWEISLPDRNWWLLSVTMGLLFRTNNVSISSSYRYHWFRRLCFITAAMSPSSSLVSINFAFSTIGEQHPLSSLSREIIDSDFKSILNCSMPFGYPTIRVCGFCLQTLTLFTCFRFSSLWLINSPEERLYAYNNKRNIG